MPLGFIRRHPAWTWVLAVSVLLAILAIFYIPRTIRWGIEGWLERQGPVSVKVENVDFNPFTGRLVVHTLVAQREEAPGRLVWEQATLNIEWWPLTQKRLRFENLDLSDAVVTIRREQEAWFVGGFKIQTGKGGGESAWQLGFGDVDLRNIRIRYLDGELQKEILVEEAHLGGMQAWNPGNPGALRLRLEVADGRIGVEGQARIFADSPSLDGRLQAEGVQLAWLEPWLQPSMNLESALLRTDLQVKGRYRPESQRLHLHLSGEAGLEALQGRFPPVALHEGGISWEGTVEIAAPRTERPPLITAEGTLSTTGLHLAVPEENLTVRLGEARIETSYAMGTSEMPPGVDFLLGLSGSTGDVAVSDSGKDLLLATWESLAIRQARLKGTHDYALEELQATGVRILERSSDKPLPFYLQAEELIAAGLRYGTKEVPSADVLRVEGLQALVVRGEQGNLSLDPWSLAPGEEEAPEQQGEKEGGKKREGIPPVRLGRLDIGAGSRVLLRDRSLQPDLRVALDPLKIQVTDIDTSAEPPSPAQFDILLEANGNPLSLQGEVRPGATFTLQAQLALRQWPVSLLEPFLKEQATLENGRITVESRLRGSLSPEEERLELGVNGSLRLSDLDAATESLRVQGSTLSWTGTADVRSFFGTDSGPPAVTARGELQAPRLALILPEAQLKIEAEDLQLREDFALGTQEVPRGAPWLLVTEGTAESLRVRDREKDLNLASLSELSLTGGRLEGPERISAEALRAAALKALERPGEVQTGGTHYLQANAASVENLRTEGPVDVRAKAITIEGLQGIVAREKNGDFPFGQWTEGGSAPKGAPASEREEERETLRLAVERVRVDGESRLHYVDRSVDPAVDLELQPFELRMENLDTAADQTETRVNLDGRFALYSHLRLNGTVTRFSGEPTMELLAEVESFSLPELSGYVQKFLGYGIQSGNLDLRAPIRVERGELDADMNVTLTKLNLTPLETEVQEETNRALGFPLQMGLSLLRNKEGVIELNIPVTGNLQSPEFGFTGVIRSALFKAVRSAALAYLSPVGAVAKIGKGLLFGKLLAVRFDPVLFPPGETALTPEATEHLQEVAEKLADREKITLVVCGVAIPEELAASVPEELPPILREELLELARLRAESVRDYLVEGGIGPERLIPCSPEIDREGRARPRVEIGL